MLAYFPDFFSSEKIEIMLVMVKRAIASGNANYTRIYYVTDAVLLLTLIIQYLADRFTEQQTKACFELYQAVHTQINNLDEQDSEKWLLIDKQEAILLNFFYKAPEKILPFVCNDLPQLVTQLLENSIYFETLYDRKVLIFGLINLLKKLIEANNEQLEGSIIKLFNFITLSLSFIANQEMIWFYDQIKDKRTLRPYEEQCYVKKKELLTVLPFDSSNYPIWFEQTDSDAGDFYDDDEIDYHMNDNKMIQEKENMALSITSNLIEMDEYIVFKELIKLISSVNNGELLTNLLTKSTPATRKYIKEVVNKTRYVKLQGKDRTKLRKIVKLKRPVN